MAPKTAELITEDQANEALQQLLPGEESESPVQPAAEPESPAEETVEAVVEPTEPAVEEPEETDDVTLLRTRNKELESEVKENEERFQLREQARQEREVASDKIRQDRYLRKSTALDTALKLLEGSRTEAGVAEGDVDRFLQEARGTMHPASPSYVAPETPTAGLTEDQALVANCFLNEKGMTQTEATEFSTWIKVDAPTQMSQGEQDVARTSLDGFLRLAHSRWQEGVRVEEKKARTDDAVGAVKSVQRTQREAARAASPSTAAPRAQRVAPKEIDVSKLTPDDVSGLLKESCTQYK